tara:strand:+ start:37 stop:522 length:486 start_codon:yes stop_codon:yes gene_type:complete
LETKSPAAGFWQEKESMGIEVPGRVRVLFAELLESQRKSIININEPVSGALAQNILVLVKAFKASTGRCIGQPLKSDIEKAAFEHRNLSKQVYKRIKQVLPRRNMKRSFQSTGIKKEIDDILADYKNVFTQGIGAGVRVMDEHSDSDEKSILVGNFEKVKI